MEDEGTGERNKPREGSLRYLLPRRTCQPRLARQRADSESARQNERRVARLPCLLFCYPCRPVRDDNGENDHRSKHGSTWYQRHLPSKDDASTLDASCLQHPILFPSLLVPTVTLFFSSFFFYSLFYIVCSPVALFYYWVGALGVLGRFVGGVYFFFYVLFFPPTPHPPPPAARVAVF